MDKRIWTPTLAKALRLALVAVLLSGLEFSAAPPLSAQAALHIIYVKADATGKDDGSSWKDAFTDLQNALAAAHSGDDIWVAMGTYKPTAGGDRTATFHLKSGVALYGGFAGWETAREQRDWEANVTILSGDIGLLADDSDNSYHVVTGNGTYGTAVLDGFTITGGNADVDSAVGHDRGGGMYIYNGSPTLANCTFSSNSALHYGGGMYNWFYSNPTLSNCTFSDNLASKGGGMYNAWYSNPTLTNVTFSDNSASTSGGGMHNESYSNPTLTNVTFSDNSASTSGGGMHNESYSDPTLANCTFSGNSANSGGGMANKGSAPTLSNCTFSGNSATNGGGGMYNHEDSDPALTNVTFNDNSAVWGGGGMYNDRYSDPTLANVTFNDNSAVWGGGGMYNHGGSPTLTNCTFGGNSAVGNGGGMYNDDSNSVLANCTLSGNSADFGGAMYNLYSKPTLTNCTLSGNSADFGGGIFNLHSEPTLANCTFSNSSAYHGGGMYSDVNSNPMLRNTIVANSTAGGDCSGDGAMISDGYNLDSDGTCGFTGEGDLSNTDPLLGPLQDNGGPTLTHALLAGSPAIDGGNPTGCTDPWGNPLTADQRGAPRPVDGNCDDIPICDMGAYEVSPTCYFPTTLYLPIVLKSAP